MDNDSNTSADQNEPIGYVDSMSLDEVLSEFFGGPIDDDDRWIDQK